MEEVDSGLKSWAMLAEELKPEFESLLLKDIVETDDPSPRGPPTNRATLVLLVVWSILDVGFSLSWESGRKRETATSFKRLIKELFFGGLRGDVR